MRRDTWILIAILVTGALVRVGSAARAPLELIERDEFIPAALTLSLDHHPIRVAQHGALPMYFIRASALIFGHSTLGYRALSVAAGVSTILLLYLIASRWWGPVPGLIAAGMLAVDRYHATVSARAVDLPFDLAFVGLAAFCFSEFLRATSREGASAPAGRWLYGAAVATGLGFLCKELTALLVPVFFVGLVLTGRAGWLRRREPWVAVLLFAFVIGPDLYSNLTVTTEERRLLFERHQGVLREAGAELTDPAYVENGLYMTYGDHLSRFRGVGFNGEPFYFYFGDIFDRMGVAHVNGFGEFPYMHPLMAAVLWLAVIVSGVRRPKDALTITMLTMAVGLFLPFVLLQLGSPRSILPTGSEALWYWVDRSALAAMLLAGQCGGWLMSRLLPGAAPELREPRAITR